MQILCCNSTLQEVVTLERFGLLLKWFGPLTFKNKNIVDKIFNIVSHPWFHGEILRDRLSILTTKQTEKLQKSKKDKKEFLVRFSESEPIEKHPFSITVFTKTNTPSYRVNYDSDSGMYSVSVLKKGELVTRSHPDLPGLMENLVGRKSIIRLEGLKYFVQSDLFTKIFSTFSNPNYQPQGNKEEEDDDDDDDD